MGRGGFVIAACASCFGASAVSQEYKVNPVNNSLRSQGQVVRSLVTNPADYAQNKERFDAYFQEFFFPAMTRSSPDGLAELGKSRNDLFNRFLWKTDNEQLQRDLTEMTFRAMLPIVKDPGYHPSVCYNAMLILGMLDEQYAVEAGPDRRPPKPYLQANEILIKAVAAAIAGKIPPSLMVGALVGLERHAKYYEWLPAKSLADTTDAALTILSLKEPLPDMDSEVFVWVKLQAATVLANLGAIGEGNRVNNALIKLIADRDMSLDQRCQAAALLENIKYEGATLEAKSTLESLSQLAVEVSQAEAKRARAYQEAQISGGGPRGGRGRGRGYYSEESEAYDRRPLLSLLTDLRRGLAAVKPALPADEQRTIETLVAAIGPVLAVASDKDVIDLDVVGKVQTMAVEINRAARTGVAASDDTENVVF